MKKTISQLMAVLLFTATFFTACKKEDQANTCASYDLNGTWIRQNDPAGYGAQGMEITYSASTGYGTITKVPSTLTNSPNWYVGAYKWYGYKTSDCTINDSKRISDYGNWEVRFDDANTFVIIQGTSGDIIYKRK